MNYSKLIYDLDSYKLSHFKQLPEGTEYMYSVIESRKDMSGLVLPYEGAVFFGLQRFIKTVLSPEGAITKEDVDYAEELYTAHGVPFNRRGWDRIVSVYGGMLPIKIKALPEGTITPTRIPMVTVENTDPTMPWLTSLVETAILRAVWYPTTVATLSREMKRMFNIFIEKTSDNPEAINFMLHDFGSRGVSSRESAEIGGMAHLVNFKGTDTVAALLGARFYYGAHMAGFSIPASEHSTMTVWTKTEEVEAYRNMLRTHAAPGSIFACVSDSYDIFNAVANIWGGELREEVIALGKIGARLVIRPDSGRPDEVILRVLEILGEKFGYEKNSKGFKVLPPYLRVIQGDGVTYAMAYRIASSMCSAGWAIDNLAFGMGGGLLQQVNRDNLGFAMKTTAAVVNGSFREVFKDPITDPGKMSKRGYARVYRAEDGDIYYARREAFNQDFSDDMLKTVYTLSKSRYHVAPSQTLEEISERAKV